MSVWTFNDIIREEVQRPPAGRFRERLPIPHETMRSGSASAPSSAPSVFWRWRFLLATSACALLTIVLPTMSSWVNPISCWLGHRFRKNLVG